MRTDFFFSRMITREEWDNPDLLLFTNAEIPLEDVELGTYLDEIIAEHRLPDPPSQESEE